MIGMSETRRLASFGPFEADLVTGELRKDGAPVPLQPQPFRLLRALVERPGELVSRDELRRTLWAEGTFVAFERGLTSAMRKAREALGDRADAPRYIETLPGRGYRFIAPVTFGRPRPASAPPLARRRFAWVAGLLVAALALGDRASSPAIADERLEAALSLSTYACRLKTDGRVEEALAVIRQAHALAPESARITAEVGFLLHAARQYDAEMPMLRRAVAQDARSVDAWLHLGLGHARRADFAEALEALQRAEALAPENASVARWLAWARAQARSQGVEEAGRQG
jgi:DNA-binding winged helix-turn-helix (wHTH) protein